MLEEILFLVRRQMASLSKIEFSHLVVSGVVGPHGCKYLTDQAKCGTDTLSRNLEEGNGVLTVFEVCVYLQPAAEVPPLAPGSSFFLEDGSRETLSDCLLISIVFSCRL